MQQSKIFSSADPIDTLPSTSEIVSGDIQKNTSADTIPRPKPSFIADISVVAGNVASE